MEESRNKMTGNLRMELSSADGSATAGDAPLQHLIWALLAIALVANAAVVLVGLPRTGGKLVGPQRTDDDMEYGLGFGDLYDFIAKNLDQGHGYRVEPYMGETILREPGYPLLIAGVFKILGFQSRGPRLLCILLAFGSALLLMRLSRKITGDGTVALVAALCFMLYPGTLVAETRAGNELPCIAAMLLFMLALYCAMEKGSVWLFGLAGLLLGVAALMRSEVLMFPLFVLAYLFFTAKSWNARGVAVLQIVVLGVGTLVAMSPWIVRNYLLVHQIVPTDSLGGVAAQEGLFTCQHLSEYEGFYAAQRGAGRERAATAERLGLRFEGSYYYQFFFTPQDEMKFNRALLDQVKGEYRGHPEVLAACATQNLVFKFWFLGKSPQATRLNLLLQLPMLMIAMGGVIVLYRIGLLQKAALCLLYIVYIPVIHAPIIAHARHSMLVFAFLTLPGAVFMVWGWRSVRTKVLAHGS